LRLHEKEISEESESESAGIFGSPEYKGSVKSKLMKVVKQLDNFDGRNE